MNIRKTALEVLTRTGGEGGYSNLALDAAIKKHTPEPRDRALLTALVMGAIEKRITLDYYIDALSSLPPEKIEPQTRNILRLGLYQLMYMDRIPSHAAVSESVALAPRRAAGFINALLRGYIRRGSDIKLPDAQCEPALYLSVRHSFPAPLCRRFIGIFGVERTSALLEAVDRPPELTLRVNTLKVDRKSLLDRFIAAGMDARPTVYSDNGIILPSLPVQALPGFADGDFFVQDEASQLCVAAADARPGMLVLDICSAPGSKSFGSALRMNNNGRIISFDLHENKLSLIRSGSARLGISIIETYTADGRAYRSELDSLADLVICDVPCSGYGVMSKKPEIRFKDPSAVASLPAVQYAILENCSRYVKPGGRLVYSTCTVLPEENEANISKFLSAHENFVLIPFSADSLNVPDGLITLTPDIHATDGFFIAVMKRRERE